MLIEATDTNMFFGVGRSRSWAVHGFEFFCLNEI